MSEVAKEILDKYWDLLLPVKVDDLACRCGIYIKPLNEHLSKRYSGAYSDQLEQSLGSLEQGL